MSGLVDLSEGAIFAGQFKVVRPLARGGMGAVYVVEQLGTARERALKLMHPQIASDEKSIERFQREAQVASKIESDHVVEVIAAGVDAKTATPWLCMELLKGETLADRIETRGRLSPADTIEVVKQLGHALSAAHRAGIVHRDLKPENIFLGSPRREGVPFTLKVLDFGVAALVADAAGAKTTQGVGSPMWMAPEQTNVGRVTTATDVWALGLIAFYLLTGKVYWKSPSIEGSSLTALLVEMMVEEMPAPSQRAAELMVAGLIPPGFDAWFARTVERDPTKRLADASVAMNELIPILEGAPPVPAAFAVTAPPATIAATRAALASTVPTPPTVVAAAPAPPPRSSSGLMLGIAGVVVVGLVGAGALAMWLGRAPDPTVVPTQPPPSAPAVAVDESEDEDQTEDESGSEDESESESDDEADDESDDESDDEAESEGDDESDDETESEDRPAPPPRRAARPSAGAAIARSQVLDSCWRGVFEGEPAPAPERWTFDFTLDGSGRGSNVRITGPTGGAFTAFRGCVVTHVAQYHPPDGTTHVALTLP